MDDESALDKIQDSDTQGGQMSRQHQERCVFGLERSYDSCLASSDEDEEGSRPSKYLINYLSGIIARGVRSFLAPPPLDSYDV